MRILVAGVGNVLRGDDGFGVVVVQRLMEQALPSGVEVMDVGIGGIHLVQEMLTPVDALVVVDAIDLGRPPGTVLVVVPDVEDVIAKPLAQRRDELADMHYSTPQRALMLARALGVLPASVWIVGCQPKDAERLGEGLSDEVESAVGAALAEVRRVVAGLGVAW
jgi:hydrogenase maturation protease